MRMIAYTPSRTMGWIGVGVLFGLLTGCRQPVGVPKGRLAEAQVAMQQSDYVKARELLQQVITDQPQSLTAHINLGMAHWRLGDLTAATAAFYRATEIAPEHPLAWRMLGQLLIADANYDGATEVLANIKQQDEVVLTLRAIALQNAENPALAFQLIEKALAINPGYAPAQHTKTLLQQKKTQENIDQPIITPPPQDSQILIEQPAPIGQEQSATTASQTATTPPPDVAKQAPPASAPKASVQAMIRKANSEIESGDHDRALLTLKNAVQTYPDNADAVWSLAVFYDRHAGIKERADGLYKTFVDMFPDDPRAVARKRQAAAEAAASKPKPKPPEANFFNDGLDHYKHKRWDEAIVAYRKALSQDPKSASCAYNLGLSYKAKEDLNAAAESFRHALNIDPEMVKALYMLGLTENQRKRNADALAHLNKLIRIEPDFAKAHLLLGNIYQSENRADMAIVHFERFLLLTPDDIAAPQVRKWLTQPRR